MFVKAARLRNVRPSVTKEITRKASQLTAAGRDVLTLSQGEPDFDTPAHIQAFAKRAMDAGETRYTDVAGKRSLRDAIAEDIRASDALRLDPQCITVGCGAKQVLFNAFMAMLCEGDEVVIPAPFWVSYPAMVELAGGRPIVVNTAAENGYKLLPDVLDKALSPKTRCLILNSPNNPTGAVYSEQDLAELAAVLQGYPGTLVISDEIYRLIFYGGDRAPSLFSQYDLLADRLLVVNGVSKAYAMTGWRVGWGAGPKELIRSMNTIQSQSSSHTCSIAQAAAEAAYRGSQQSQRDMTTSFQMRRDLVVERLAKIEGLSLRIPDGAFYVFVSCRDLLGTRTQSGRQLSRDTDFADFLLEEQGVAVVPGSAFGAEGHIRVSCAADDDMLEDGCERIAKACGTLSVRQMVSA